MTAAEGIDIKENEIVKDNAELSSLLLRDNTTKKNILWATSDYLSHGRLYGPNSQITIAQITGVNGEIIKPRVEKSKEDQTKRSKDKAEVFTPSWICNKQNNLIDNAWFGDVDVFNIESEKGWTTQTRPIPFPAKSGKTWQEYITATRLEITCGEAPYLVSRYDTITGDPIAVQDRIGLLDRKLRVLGENVDDEAQWFDWAKRAFQSTYGFEWQGDNLLLARENMLYTFIDNYQSKFNKKPSNSETCEIAEIISWNIWQMDGLKGVVPDSCSNKTTETVDLFGEVTRVEEKCEGCSKGNPKKHNGIYCKIKDWEAGKTLKFVSLLK